MSPPEQGAPSAKKRAAKKPSAEKPAGKTEKPQEQEPPTAEVLAAMWSEAFAVKVDVHDSFVKLGGDSRTAATIATRVQEKFGVALDLRVFATDLSVSALAAMVEQNKGRR